MTFVIIPRTVGRFFLGVVLVLTFLSISGDVARFRFDTTLHGLVPLFDLNREQNIPTWYAASSLLLCAVLLGVCGTVSRQPGGRFEKHWFFLMMVFCGLSVDELSSLHERFSSPVRAVFGVDGMLYFAWVVPAFLFVAVLLVAYWRFLASLPHKIRWGFLLAGAVYVAGAIGMELVGGEYVSSHGGFPVARTMTYAGFTTVEELLEMIGVVIFLTVLITYLREQVEEIRLRLTSAPS